MASCAFGTSLYIDGLLQDCSISIANPLEILQSCTEPSIEFDNYKDFSFILYTYIHDYIEPLSPKRLLNLITLSPCVI